MNIGMNQGSPLRSIHLTFHQRFHHKCIDGSAIALLAKGQGITQAQIWHLRSLWIGGAL
ncbi:MAG: hypothetical protein WBA57_18840 [Elainellaceae cyanobacterium]